MLAMCIGWQLRGRVSGTVLLERAQGSHSRPVQHMEPVGPVHAQGSCRAHNPFRPPHPCCHPSFMFADGNQIQPRKKHHGHPCWSNPSSLRAHGSGESSLRMKLAEHLMCRTHLHSRLWQVVGVAQHCCDVEAEVLAEFHGVVPQLDAHRARLRARSQVRTQACCSVEPDTSKQCAYPSSEQARQSATTSVARLAHTPSRVCSHQARVRA